MNRIFKVIWDTTTNTYKVAGETAKSRGKKTGGRKLAAIALLGLSGLAASGNALAATGNDTGTGVTPEGGSAGTGWVAIGTGVTANTQTDVNGASAALGYYSSAMGAWSTAIGSYSKSDGDASLALGVKASSAGDRGIAMGASSNAEGSYSMAMGVRANAIGSDSVALGNGAKSTGNNAVSLGHSSDAAATDSVAIGNTATATGTDGIAIGDSTASGINSVAIGNTANASGSNTIALGNAAKANKEDAIALGNNANADAINAIAIGEGAKASGDKSIALGNDAKVTALNSVALGDGSNATEDNTVAVGNATMQRRVTYVDKGIISSSSTDAVNGSQIYNLSSSIATRLGGGASVNVNGSVNAPEYILSAGTYNNVGDALTALDKSYTTVAGDALLWDETLSAFSATHGTNTASKITNVAAGTLSAESTDAVNGAQLFETNQNVTQNTTDIATLNTSVTDINTSITNMGTSITNLNENALQWDETLNAYSAAHGTDTTSKITNVTAGALSAESTDAVNGAQLFETNQNVTQNTTDIATLNTSVTDINTSITDMGTSIITLTNDALLWDNSANAYSAAHGTDTASKITNVAAGTLSAESTDAVNGAQLFETNQNVTQNTTDIATLNTSVTDINTSITDMGTTITTLSENSLQWDETLNAYSAAHGSDTASKITNVAAGELAAESTDAVNGAQLYETNMLIEQTNEAITNIAGDTSETYITNNGTGVKYVRTNDEGLAENDAHASGLGATAVGYNAVASGAGSLAMGQNSISSVDTGIALGSGSTSNRVIATGKQATSVSEDGVTIGYDTTDRTLLGALSLGTDGESYRQITNVADGTESQDAVTVRQLQNAVASVSTTPTKYFHANSEEEDSLAVGTNAIAVGAKTVVNGDEGIGIGYGATVEQTASNGIALGTNAVANQADSIALGSYSQTGVGAQSSYIAYNLTAPQTSIGEVSVGNANGQRQITNVAAGSADTDAVNVAQLKVTDSKVTENTANITTLTNQYTNLNTRVTTLENNMGDITVSGGSDYLAVNTTGDVAIATGDESVAVGPSSMATANNSVALGAGSIADEANTVSVGSSTQQRRITNVAAGVNNTDAVNVAQLKASEEGSVRYETNTDGSVNYSAISLGDGSGGTTRISNVSAAVNDTDAVNYAQLKQSVEEANYYTDQKMGEMSSKIQGVEDKMSGGIASAMAMAGLPQAYAPGASMTSIAGGTFNGETAIALGVSVVSESGGWVYKLQGTSNSQGDYSAAIGAGFQW